MTKRSHYPSYDVMKLQEDWDDHTRSIVTARLIREHDYLFLKLSEAELLRAACAVLVDDHRGEIIQYVLSHLDEKLHQALGEGQRKRNVPEERRLIREGAKALDRSAYQLHGKPYQQIGEEAQRRMMQDLSQEILKPEEAWMELPQKDFFHKLLTLTVEAYYSHPTVWSEIGYGGPAYPRGYIRADFGQLDPWEAKKEQ